ncbi:hypothetical protein BESB_008920 [Besnoitia besnoiti]|uniref:Transmembrane protein n=1 Tax=Besnoitia besnoiti TaxID=94643 RepID=A0A2A9MQV0_BESBE|nr:hypothetical protein BESB_008920 [Besnoitia besnoiti]PFH38550.1 hypothetical protein BESB_008920 [Besnoitia besnoiti]
MYLGGVDDIPIEGTEYEKSKPRILLVSLYCGAAIGGCVAMGIFGALLYYFYRAPTHLSITLALATSLATLFMAGFIWLGILVSSQMQIWLTDTVTKIEFIVYLLDSMAAGIALYQVQYVFNSPTSGGPRSFLPRLRQTSRLFLLHRLGLQGAAQRIGGETITSQNADSRGKS